MQAHDGGFISVFHEALMITSFVAVMMVLVEYVNTKTKGTWNRFLTKNKASQYLLSLILGAFPGCLGSFVVVTLYTHKVLSVGALVACMIITVGDEAFVILAKSLSLFFLLTGILAVVALCAGIITDIFFESKKIVLVEKYDHIPFHEADELHEFNIKEIKKQLKECTPARGILAISLFLFLVAHLSGRLGPEKEWARITLALLTFFAFVIVLIVPDHFLEEHIWGHVAKIHVPRIFFWTLGTLFAMSLIPEEVIKNISSGSGAFISLLAACLIGLIPETGPHLIFIFLFIEKGSIPFSVLLASSIVQDGHGMLPLLAHSRFDFIVVKGINFFVGLLVGILLMIFGV